MSANDSVLQRRVMLADILDPESFSEVVKGFVELYKVGIKIFDEKGAKLTDIKIGNGDFCGYVFSFPEGRKRCTQTVGRVKDGPIAASHGARLPVLDAEIAPRAQSMVTLPCFTGLRYLILPIKWEGDILGRVVFGPFLPDDLKSFPPPTLTEISSGLDIANAQELVSKVRKAPEGTVARVMLHFAQLLQTMLFSGQKIFLTSQLHIEATQVANRELEERAALMQKANVKLKELDRLKSAFLATVSHELRTPLTSIIGYSEMLLEGLAGELNTEQLDYVKTIMDKGETLLKLISSILDISQIEAGKVRLSFEEMSPGDLVNSSVSSIKPQAQKKGVSLDVKMPAKTTIVKGDRDRLRQVLTNLLTNALKFTTKGGQITVTLSDVGVQPEFSAPGYSIAVTDTGLGIPKDQFEKIFHSFYQVDSSSTREFGGAGLGLAIVKSFVEGHGGRVRVESEVNKGSTFVVVLPSQPSNTTGEIDAPVTGLEKPSPPEDRF